MSGSGAVASAEEIEGRGIKLLPFSRLGQNEELAVQKAVVVEAGRRFHPRLGIGVDGGDCAVCGPAFEKDFALGDGEMAEIHALARPDGRIVNPDGLAPVWDKAA